MIGLFDSFINYIAKFSTLEAFGIMLIFGVIVRYLNKMKPLKHYIIITTMKMIVLLAMIFLVGTWGVHQILLSGDNTVEAMLLCGTSEISNFYGTFSAVRDFIKWIKGDKNTSDNSSDKEKGDLDEEKADLDNYYDIMENLTNDEKDIVMELFENGQLKYSEHNIQIRSLLAKDVIRCTSPNRGTPARKGDTIDYCDRSYNYELNMWAINIINKHIREVEKNTCI